MNSVFKNIEHECDLCIVGGGLSGMCAAIAAARHGSKVVIMQDRPVFGGNVFCCERQGGAFLQRAVRRKPFAENRRGKLR